MRSLLLSMLIATLLASCAQHPKQFVVLLANEDGTVGAVEVQSNQGSIVISDTGSIADIDNPTATVARLSDEEISRAFGKSRAALPLAPVSFILYFKSDSNDLAAESQAALTTVFSTIEGRLAPQVAIVGHTDRVGEAVYNFQLSAARANLVRDLLLARGLREDMIHVSWHGENNPLVPTPDEWTEPLNRRVEIIVR